MKPKNFPGRKQIRRESAIARLMLNIHTAKNAHNVIQLREIEENTKANLVEDARMVRTKVSREVKKYGY